MSLNPSSDYILYAEDNDVDAMLFQRAFKTTDKEVKIVRFPDGVQTWEYLQETVTDKNRPLPKLCIFDIKMPGLNGLDLLQKVKEREQTAHLPVVLFTASYEQRDLDYAYQQHVNAYIVKPERYASLRQLVGSLKTFWLEFNHQPK